MSDTFHPAENGDYKPLREKADSLYLSAVAWQLSPIPSDYKEKETKETLAKLVGEVKAIAEAIKKGIDDKALFTMINNAHDTFHKIVGECKKDDGHGHGSHDGHGH
jgi:DNA-dependent RNA polymerase auxiliary subunit epsilon